MLVDQAGFDVSVYFGLVDGRPPLLRHGHHFL